MTLQVTDVERMSPDTDDRRHPFGQFDPDAPAKKSRWRLLAVVAGAIGVWTLLVVVCLFLYGRAMFYLSEYRIGQQVILFNVQQGKLALPPGMSVVAPPAAPQVPAVVSPASAKPAEAPAKK